MAPAPVAAQDELMETEDDLRLSSAFPLEEFDIDNLEPIKVPEPLPVAACGSDENGRLVISHITNINFKSYAGTTVLGPFQKVVLQLCFDTVFTDFRKFNCPTCNG